MDPELLEKAVEDMTKATSEGFAKLTAKLDDERKEREALEVRMQRQGLGSGPTATVGKDTIDRASLADELKAMDKFARSAGNGDVSEIKALSVGSDPDGGYFVLPQRSTQMITRLFEESPIRRLARIETLDGGDSFEEEIDLDEAGATWVGENASRPATDTPRVGVLKVPLCEVYAAPKATQKLLDTAHRDVGAWLDGKINDKFARSDARAFILGDTPLQPRGFLAHDKSLDDDFTRPFGTLQYVKTGHASNFKTSNPADQLKQLMWSLRAPYRRGATWLMNSNTASVIDQFKDGQGNYLWRDGATAGAPPSLFGYPVEFDENMPDLGANEFPVAFGNWMHGYLIVERPGLKLLRDPFTDKPNVILYAYRRVGGDVANSDAIKLLKCEA
ncbi:phage major capsid protein [Methyloceanibacter caenitepidi]|uniref:Phage major capsid protein n=1 Tax=Methyloceanibacter caenitepidi TaxID=1384459 RepID=A0A0A8K3U8_9HYPH|nr:phage major capsid protein [Methyloceanibacter caenitepidi]BAQ17436.1 phage major capsid protein [Methyloceanibacter caenitepidi]